MKHKLFCINTYINVYVKHIYYYCFYVLQNTFFCIWYNSYFLLYSA